MKIRAISVNVLRPNYDCTNGGVSSRYDKLYVVCPDGNFEFDFDNAPDNLMRIHVRLIGGKTVYSLQPMRPCSTGCVGWMAGGNYAASCDSRFGELIGGMYGAVAIHDRQETREQYNMMD